MVKIAVGVMGGSPFAMTSEMSTSAKIRAFLNVCKAHDVTELDTARIYGDGSSESMLGELSAAKDFAISTKIRSGQPTDGTLSYDRIIESAKQSLEALHVDKVDILYIHQPDSQTPLSETLRAVDRLYRDGTFSRFGICHYDAEQVKQIHTMCKESGYVLPTVYQGNYNPIARSAEHTLLPILRELGLTFYGFGATAGGALAKPLEQILSPPEGSRWSILPIMKMVYGKQTVLDQIKHLHEECDRHGIPIGEASVRWIRHHSALGDDDVILLGASSGEQMEKNLSASKQGPLPMQLAGVFDEAWPCIERASEV